jgi:hypothetical protein
MPVHGATAGSAAVIAVVVAVVAARWLAWAVATPGIRVGCAKADT